MLNKLKMKEWIHKSEKNSNVCILTSCSLFCSDHLSTAFAPLVNDKTTLCISSFPSLCYHCHPIRNYVGVRRVWSFREGVGEKGERDIALGQCVYAEINKQSNIHKLDTAIEQFVSPKETAPENKLSFSFLTFFRDSPFFGRMSKFKDTGSLGSLKEEEVEKRQKGVWQWRRGEKAQDTSRLFACFLHQILFLSCWGSSV